MTKIDPEQSKKILLVDDEEEIANITLTRLKSEGFAVELAPGGAEALDKLKKYSPDLIILDIMMPGLNGFEVLKRLKINEETKAIPVIMLTSKGDRKALADALALGANDYCVKPFTPGVLYNKIKKALLLR